MCLAIGPNRRLEVDAAVVSVIERQSTCVGQGRETDDETVEVRPLRLVPTMASLMGSEALRRSEGAIGSGRL